METKGENSLIFDADGLKSGIYLATLSLRSNGKEIHRSIIMVKGR
jgi:hypothetical protein